MKLTPKDAYKIKQASIALFKDNHFTSYEADLQATICTVMAFIAHYESITGHTLEFELDHRLEVVPVDDL